MCCIAKRCVTSSVLLKKLPLKPYTGDPILDANQRPLPATHVISVNFTAGSPVLSLSVDFVVVDHLPYSCIIGNSLLSKLNDWGVNNVTSTLRLNSSVVNVYDAPLHDERITLITSEKTSFAPGETKRLKTRTTGPGMSPYRPITEELWMFEGASEREDRCSVRVCPALNIIGTGNENVVYVQVTNTSAERRTVGKGVKLAHAHKDFSEVSTEEENIGRVNAIVGEDVVEFLCKRDKYRHLTDEQFKQVKQLIQEFKDIFTISSEKMGKTNVNYFDIDVDNMRPVAVPIRRVPLHKEQVVKELVDRYVELGLLEEIDSPFRAAMVLVEKKNLSEDITDRYRLCVDYRVLNQQIPDSAWPAPSVEHCLDAAAGSVFFSKLDFNNGYYQIPCTPAAKQALAFSPGIGFSQYTFNGMPPGAKSAASVFQQTMEKSFRGLEDCILPPYYDDVNIKSSTFTNHLRNARLVFQRIRDCNYTLNALKCSFFQTCVKYLGHVIEKGTVKLDPQRVAAIVEIPVPQDVKSLRRFIGMVQYCSRFLPRLNDKLSPLTNLLRKNVSYKWDEECQAAFDYVKEKLMNPPILQSPSTGDTFVLETDASDSGTGGCLKVISATNGQEFIAGYHSGKFKDQQLNWHIVEKEAFAILENLTKFKHYLIGKRFTLKTDNRVLTYVKTSKSKKLANWALQMSDFDFDIIHIPSTDNRISDFFSRIYEHVNIISVLDPVFSTDDLREAQAADESIKQSLLYLKSKKNFDVTRLGPLKRFRKFLDVDANGILVWKNKIVLPTRFRQRVLEAAHDHPAAGHFADTRTWKNVTSKFFWPDAHNDVVNWVRSCKACNQFDIKQYVKRPLQPIDTTGRFELVSYDIAGPFLPSKTLGNIYALIIVDHFTKWPEIIPLKNIQAWTLATVIFEQWCCRYGVMAQLHSDGASNVHGEVMKELCKRIGTVKSKSSRLHPQGDGMAEAMVKMLKNAIKKQVDTHGSDWDQYVQATAFAIRSSINNSTNCTPAELVLGDNLMRPIDVSATTDDQGTPKSYAQEQASDFATTLTRRIEDASKVVQNSLQQSRRKMKASYDRSSSSHAIKVGDSVMLWWPYFKKGISRAFQPKWKGPFLVKELNGDTNCTIVMEDGSDKHVHLNQLKPVQQRHATAAEAQDVDEPVDLRREFCDALDVLCEDEEESDYESAVEHLEDDDVEDEEDDRWCGVDEGNIILPRTRSGLGGGGG